MKLRNKKTDEIHEITEVVPLNDMDKKFVIYSQTEGHNYAYKNLAELNSEWEDATEEPKKYYFIDPCGEVHSFWEDEESPEDTEASRQIGNYFLSREEAEQAVEKLKAWKRLKDKGFRPKMWEWEYIYNDNISGELIIKALIDDATDSDGKYTKDLDLLFGGEE